jgi:hypothetical protein
MTPRTVECCFDRRDSGHALARPVVGSSVHSERSQLDDRRATDV